MLWFPIATIHLSRDTEPARPFPLQWITGHTPTDLPLSIQFPLRGHLICCLPTLSMIYRPWCIHAARPLSSHAHPLWMANKKSTGHVPGHQPRCHLLSQKRCPVDLLQRKRLCRHHAWVYTHGALKGTNNPFCLQQLMPCLFSPPRMLGMGTLQGATLLHSHLPHAQKSGWVRAQATQTAPGSLHTSPAPICSSETEQTSHSSSPTIQE